MLKSASMPRVLCTSPAADLHKLQLMCSEVRPGHALHAKPMCAHHLVLYCGMGPVVSSARVAAEHGALLQFSSLILRTTSQLQ